MGAELVCGNWISLEILGDLGLANSDALYQGLGEGDITLAQVAGAVHRRLHERQEVQRGPKLAKPAANGGSAGMVIDGVGDLLSTIARCCRPVPPEEILGYITIGRGVSIHRANCSACSGRHHRLLAYRAVTKQKH